MKKESDSREWKPPADMKGIFQSLKAAEIAVNLDRDAPGAIRHLLLAVEDLAMKVAEERDSANSGTS